MPVEQPPKICAVRPLVETRLFAVEAVDLVFANGTEVTFERLAAKGRGAVLVVPVLDDGRIVLIREYACGTERYELGLPKGRIDGDEPILDAANRELMEEAGFGAAKLTLLREVTSSPAYSAQRTHIVLATGLFPQRLPGDEPEPLEVVTWPLDDLDRLAFDGQCSEARSIAALYLARAHLAQSELVDFKKSVK
ncbi:MAG: ADP compounds hydrolase NudE [Halothiobacillus sp.]|nr:ADP compounds hydrolase NudE [Halothiobacillus sp.]